MIIIIKKLTICSAYSSNALASIDKIIKAKGLFKSLNDYYKYIIHYIMHYDVDKSHVFKIKNAGYPFASEDESKDTELLILNQPAEDFRFDNKTKSETYIEVSDRIYALLDSLNYGSYWKDVKFEFFNPQYEKITFHDYCQLNPEFTDSDFEEGFKLIAKNYEFKLD